MQITYMVRTALTNNTMPNNRSVFRARVGHGFDERERMDERYR
jgi:hypothetical protein